MRATAGSASRYLLSGSNRFNPPAALALHPLLHRPFHRHQKERERERDLRVNGERRKRRECTREKRGSGREENGGNVAGIVGRKGE